MIGFTEEELLKIMDEQEIAKQLQEKILPIMRENYDGYRFSTYGKEKYIIQICVYIF